jgi:L-ribulokinase
MELSEEAAKVPIDESGILALDWMNGRRTPDANQLLKGAISGLTLGSDAPRIFRALVEGTAFGARKIVERFRSEGVRIDGVIALGGVAKKSPFIMQIVADVLSLPIKVPRSEQTCALGAAMFAATVAGLYRTVEDAKKSMGSGIEVEYRPQMANAAKYKVLYERYLKLGEFVENEILNMGRTS